MPGLLVSLVVLVLCAGGIFLAATGRGGPDPAKWLLHQAGFFALIFLVATLTVSTLRRFIRKPVLAKWRRPVGLAAFAMATSHVIIYATIYQGFAWGPIVEDIGKRPYILIGFVAWLLLLPLAFTSTRAAQRRLGLRWVRLHRLVYLIVPLAILHQGMAQKVDLAQTAVFLIATGCLLAERMLDAKRWLPWPRKVR